MTWEGKTVAVVPVVVAAVKQGDDHRIARGDDSKQLEEAPG